jgi:thiol-disulfide isomerase/thioredoxin
MVRIEVLGTGCAKCKSLLKNVEKAVQESGIQAEVVKVDNIKEIMDRGRDKEDAEEMRLDSWKRKRSVCAAPRMSAS